MSLEAACFLGALDKFKTLVFFGVLKLSSNTNLFGLTFFSVSSSLRMIFSPVLLLMYVTQCSNSSPKWSTFVDFALVERKGFSTERVDLKSSSRLSLNGVGPFFIIHSLAIDSVISLALGVLGTSSSTDSLSYLSLCVSSKDNCLMVLFLVLPDPTVERASGNNSFEEPVSDSILSLSFLVDLRGVGSGVTGICGISTSSCLGVSGNRL
ncbi:unnamed protein product [Kuraishia capsulata CBS 1993]|uniref:Uncharacterized protein n=1 Tax=Kuraishia capsulata CBS 1993 TaxID=1382522 RepID=W6MX84_9ASCO|nr:uncharacterized protein KUCA_T00004427001 [Kuraishia capsulata CBS 1993]CDK28445.1 unnamed protein product [Kuraishia capsulata CBS 1993]